MPKVTEEYRNAKREEILDAAMRAFHRRGFQAASMADIIAESGLSAGAIYGHFASKAEIVFAVASKTVGGRLTDIAEVSSTVPLPAPATLIRVLMKGMLEAVGRPTMLVQLWGEAVTDPGIMEIAGGVVTQLRNVYVDYLTRWFVQEGKSAQDAAQLAEKLSPLYLAAAQGYILQSALFPDFDGDAYLTTIEEYLPR